MTTREVIAYVVEDSPYNREFYPFLIGKQFPAPRGYASILPYRKIKTKAIFGPKESDPNPTP